MELRARLRKRVDRDIKDGLRQLGKLKHGELSDLLRDAMRLKLAQKGVIELQTVDDIETAIERRSEEWT